MMNIWRQCDFCCNSWYLRILGRGLAPKVSPYMINFGWNHSGGCSQGILHELGYLKSASGYFNHLKEVVCIPDSGFCYLSQKQRTCFILRFVLPCSSKSQAIATGFQRTQWHVPNRFLKSA